MARMTGWDAIEYAEARGVALSKYTDPTDDAHEGLTPDEAREVASEDPGLIYLDTTSTLDTGSIVRTTSGADRGRVGIVAEPHDLMTSPIEQVYGVVTAGIGMDWYSPNEIADAGELTDSDREDLAEIHAQGA